MKFSIKDSDYAECSMCLSYYNNNITCYEGFTAAVTNKDALESYGKVLYLQ